MTFDEYWNGRAIEARRAGVPEEDIEGSRILCLHAWNAALGSLPCPHGRPSWHMCPHCNGLNALELHIVTTEGESTDDH